MYGNVGYGKNVFVLKYMKALVKIGLQRQILWKQNPLHYLFKGIPPAQIKSLLNFHVWDRPADPTPELTIEAGTPIPNDLKLPNIDYMTIDKFLGLKGEEGVRYQLGIDEPYAWGLEARRSGTDIAVEMTRKSLQSRKTGVRSKTGMDSGSDIFYLTQLPSSMDKRLKFLARAVYLALPPDEYGFHYLYMGKVYRVHHVSMDEAIKDIFPYYDTYEKIEMTLSEEFMEAAGAEGRADMKRGKEKEEKIVERGLQESGETYMVTSDGNRIFKKTARPDVWEEELKAGGKVYNATTTKAEAANN